jgi:monomeric sarcosine oxidase
METKNKMMSETRSSSSTTYDVIVIGAGGVGSAAAYHLAQAGRRVLLLEQFQVGHNRGSSHGGSRIIRYTHDIPDYARVMPQTFELWRRLERESGEHLLQMTGGLYLAPPDEPFLQGCQNALAQLNFPYRLLTANELHEEYPQFRLPAHWIALYQEHSGILAATRCVKTLAAQALRHGAEVREKTRAAAVIPLDDGVAVRVVQHGVEETIYARQAMITAGPWAGRFLKPLLPFTVPLRVTHQQVAYFAATRPELYTVGRFPIFIVTAHPHFYGFPIWERPGYVKIALEQTQVAVDPDQEQFINTQLAADLARLVAEQMVGLNPEPAIIEPCLYTETPNFDFVIDRHPQYPQILIAAGFSGRGFKHTIATGRLLVDLANSAPGVYDSPFWLERFRITRFAPTPLTVATT